MGWPTESGEGGGEQVVKNVASGGPEMARSQHVWRECTSRWIKQRSRGLDSTTKVTMYICRKGQTEVLGLCVHNYTVEVWPAIRKLFVYNTITTFQSWIRRLFSQTTSKSPTNMAFCTTIMLTDKVLPHGGCCVSCTDHIHVPRAYSKYFLNSVTNGHG